MRKSNFNFQMMGAYRQQLCTRGYNPFDYPGEWEFFQRPFAEEEEDDILTDLLFQIRKMTRRIHIFFDNDSQSETAFYFGLLDSLAEADKYLFGAMWYARYCRLEKLFFIGANHDLGIFFEKMARLQEELLSKIRSFGEENVDFNKECKEDNLFLCQYCLLTKHGVPNDMLQALLRAPSFPIDSDNNIIIDEKTNIFSYFENIKAGLAFTVEEQNFDGAEDSSGYDRILEPVDMLFWYIRGTLLWVVMMRIKCLCSNLQAYIDRHNKHLEKMCRDAYEEVCGAYKRSFSYAKRRDEELPMLCAEQLFQKGRKPTDEQVYMYFNTQYKILLLQHNKSQELYFQYRNQLNTFYVEFLNLLMNEETQEDAIDFLFIQTYGKEISSKKQHSDINKSKKIKKFREFIKDAARADEIIKKLHRLIGYKTNSDALKIITRAMWIGWLDKKPTATSIKKEFPSITCKDSQISEILKEDKPTMGGKINEKAIESIRMEYEAI